VTTKEVGKGTGLGLSVCLGIVQSWDGELSVCSSELGGARFEVKMALAGLESV
ncbi:MAG TPA: PAS domain-containing sensor histidine kinase, partial [Nitrospinaceae bacterium]|nr:PAS domain-containing sensor histidine kinase [Nitrospinaceae bacterium]